VNVPGFTLVLVDSGRPVFQGRVIVGRRDWPTPTFSSTIEAVVFRPLWQVPRKIAVQEILPLAREDPGYFGRTETRIFDARKPEGSPLDPGTVDWSRLSASNFPYTLVQEPGPTNPLGGVKLFLPSRFAVYLHDTPNQNLFDRSRRALSHGCVRVEHITALVERLLPDWAPDSVVSAMETGRDRRVPLPDPVPIEIVYRTAWIEPDGLVAFRDDIYGLDNDKKPSSGPQSHLPMHRRN